MGGGWWRWWRCRDVEGKGELDKGYALVVTIYGRRRAVGVPSANNDGRKLPVPVGRRRHRPFTAPSWRCINLRRQTGYCKSSTARLLSLSPSSLYVSSRRFKVARTMPGNKFILGETSDAQYRQSANDRNRPCTVVGVARRSNERGRPLAEMRAR